MSHNGKIMGGVKADLLKYMRPENPHDISDSSLRGTVFEVSDLANTIKSGNANTLREYPENTFILTIKSKSKGGDKIDIVFDTYKKDSLIVYNKRASRESYLQKSETRVKTSSRLKIIPENQPEQNRIVPLYLNQ